MERRQVHPGLIWLTVGCLIGWALSGFAFAEHQEGLFALALTCPFVAVGLYGVYGGRWTQFFPRISGIAQCTISLIVIVGLWLAFDHYARYMMLSRREQRVIALRSEPGCAVETSVTHPFAHWPQPVSDVSFPDVFKLTVPTDVFTTHAADIQALRDMNSLTLTGGDVSAELVSGLTKLNKARSFTGLAIQRALVTCSSLEPLSILPDLYYLRIEDCRMAAPNTALLKSLASLQNLTTLSLAGTAVESADLSAIAGMEYLEGLSLARTKIDDSAVNQILALKSLNWLDISKTGISSAGLRRLANLPHLSWLTAEEIPIEMSDLAALYDAHPNVQLVSDRGGTLLEAARSFQAGIALTKQAAESHSPDDFDAGNRAFSRAIELVPDEAEFYSGRGWLLKDEGKLSEAEQDFTAAIELASGNALYWAARAEIRLLQKNSQAAIEDATHAIDLDPALESAYSHRGRARLSLGDPQRALEDFNAALKFAPDMPFNLYWRGKTRLAIEDWDSAIRDFTATVEREPMAADAYEGRADAYDRIGQPELAEQNLRQAQRLREAEEDNKKSTAASP